MSNHYEATAEDFAKWQRYAKKLTVSELRFSIDDCLKAAAAMATHKGPNKENYYRDQAATLNQELRRRLSHN